jgi:hypothetical protein
MHLTLDGTAYDFIPIKDFRAAHHLPLEFGVALFEPKDYTGLGRIDRVGAELHTVRASILAALPERMSANGWLAFVPELSRLFEAQLHGINGQVGLKDIEVDFAVGGFSDVLHAFAYALARAKMAGEPLPDFHAVYTDWLNSTMKVFAQSYAFTLGEHNCQVQIVAHAYGRIGLLIQTLNTIYAVYDPALACPAEGFMTALLTEVAARMTTATRE